MENSMSLRDDILRVADIIAQELPTTIDGRTGNSPAHKRMHELYNNYKSTHYSLSFDEAAKFARREWIRELLAKHLGGEP
jgi:predicted RNase H-like nuclease